jgi:DNA-binding transcriptional ArsR family regulator
MKKLNDQTLDHVARRFKLLGEPMRLKLLSHLQEKEKCVQDLVDLTGAGQANVSKHLSLLTSHGILGRRKEGLHVYYFIADETVYKLCDIVCSSLGEQADDLRKAVNSA